MIDVEAELASDHTEAALSGLKRDGTFERVWFEELLPQDEVSFESDVYLLKKATAQALKAGPTPAAMPNLLTEGSTNNTPVAITVPTPVDSPEPVPIASLRTLRLTGTVPPEIWNRLGTRVLRKLRSGSELRIGLDFSVTLPSDAAGGLAAELKQILQELGAGRSVMVE